MRYDLDPPYLRGQADRVGTAGQARRSNGSAVAAFATLWEIRANGYSVTIG
jgi:hypothetical protein